MKQKGPDGLNIKIATMPRQNTQNMPTVLDIVSDSHWNTDCLLSSTEYCPHNDGLTRDTRLINQ